MDDLKPIDELDYYLELLRKRNDIATITMIIAFSGKEYSVDEYFRVRRIIDKFLRDKMVFEIPDIPGRLQPDPSYQMTYEGLLFHGYRKQSEIDEMNHVIFVHNEKRIVRNEKWLNRGTWTASIVGVMLLLWQIFLYFYPVHADYPYFFWQK